MSVTTDVNAIGIKLNNAELEVWRRMSHRCKAAYAQFWGNPDRDHHAAHRDSLPAFEHAWTAAVQAMRDEIDRLYP